MKNVKTIKKSEKGREEGRKEYAGYSDHRKRETDEQEPAKDSENKMNKRQAKKQYKKIHGHNPPKTAVAVYTPEEIEAMKIYNNLTPEDIERIANNLRSAAEEMFKALQRVAESMARVFEDMGKKYSRPVIETEEPPVVVARTLSERRKKCRRKGWRVSER